MAISAKLGSVAPLSAKFCGSTGMRVSMVGERTAIIMGPKYDGAYEVTPMAETDQILRTASKLLDADIRISKIPYAEVSNNSGGLTVTIG